MLQIQYNGLNFHYILQWKLCPNWVLNQSKFCFFNDKIKRKMFPIMNGTYGLDFELFYNEHDLLNGIGLTEEHLTVSFFNSSMILHVSVHQELWTDFKLLIVGLLFLCVSLTT